MPANLAVEQRRPVEVLADELVDPLGGVQLVARRPAPAPGAPSGTKTARSARRPARRESARPHADARSRCCRAVQPRRRSGLQPAPAETERLQRLRQRVRRRLAERVRPACCSGPMWIRPFRNVPVVTTSAGSRIRARPPARTPVDAGPATSTDFRRRRSIHSMPGCPSSASRIHAPVRLLVGLRARRPDGRAAASVQNLELDAGRVDRQAHQAAERVDLADEVPLGRPADRRVARHVRDRLASTACRARRVSPSRAAAHAASQPACPAPITMTSNVVPATEPVTCRCRTAEKMASSRSSVVRLPVTSWR